MHEERNVIFNYKLIITAKSDIDLPDSLMR